MQTLTQKAFNRSYDGLRVMVTGNTGFKGSWIALWLSKLGADVHGFSLDDFGEASHFRRLPLEIETSFGDVRNKERVTEVFRNFQPQLVFHMAAQSLVRASYVDPSFTYETNVIGTLNVMEAARHCGSVDAIVNITTDKVYENLETARPYQEEDRLGGHDPYSSSKACAEILTASYRNSYAAKAGILVASVRAGNVIGGGDWSADRLIPDLIRAARAGEVTEIRSPNATRPWQHVLDPLSGYLLLGQMLLEKDERFASAWNFGPDQSANVDVAKVVGLMQRNWKKIKYRINEEEARKFHEATSLMLNCAKVERELKWYATWGIDKSIEQTSKWYRAFCDSGKVISPSQLEEFVDDAKAIQQVWC